MVLVGQIANQKAPEETLANHTVILVAGSGKLLARSAIPSVSSSWSTFRTPICACWCPWKTRARNWKCSWARHRRWSKSIFFDLESRTMRKLSLLLIVGLVLALPCGAQSSYILTASPANMQGLVDRHGLTVVKELFDGVNCVMLVTSLPRTSPGVETEVESDLSGVSFEPEQRRLAGGTKQHDAANTYPVHHQHSGCLVGRTLVSFFGSTVPSNYTTQTATNIIRLGDARTAARLTGTALWPLSTPARTESSRVSWSCWSRATTLPGTHQDSPNWPT